MIRLRKWLELLAITAALAGPAAVFDAWYKFNFWIVVLLTMPVLLPLIWLCLRKRVREMNPSIHSFRTYITSAEVSAAVITLATMSAVMAWLTWK